MQQLFGQKVLNDFIQKQDEKLIEKRWQKYKNFLAKKEKISSWIETDYQDGFLEDIFENCLGYISKTRSKDEHYTLEREKKNETNAQKADGALLVDDKVVAVIELKDQKTKDLDKKYNREESAVRQAFGYLQYNNHAKYVIISNFNELRFYFDKATAYEQFFLFDLDYDGFKKLHTILSYESIKEGLPLKLKEKSLIHEQDISSKLYKDYTAFRTQLFENVLKNNPTIYKLELLNATQKLIDRIVFILFGEDTDLLPKNTIGTIIQKQKEVKKLVKGFTLYDSYKVYFEAINAGDEDLDITMYNGGLFAEDELLNKLIIDNEVLDARAKILSGYNFGSDISVNILGHIFENSISELEEMSAQLLNNDFDKKQSKRKKDGVFYTPAYITEYIVQNTLGKLCEDKRESLFIGSETLVSPKNPKNPTKTEQQTKDNLLIYKDWLLNLKILDPACGSGAFLNQALEYLLKEHKRLQNDLALMGDLFAVYEVEKEVLEHNLYGVDINEGAVEIARLSLWLRTAKRGRPLTKLANKIKVGNSLIDDKTVVPNAFDWHAEFPEVFAQGGFDVVIGNPPYGAKLSKEHQEFLKGKFNMNSSDTAILFVKMSFDILSNKGQLGFIIPKSFVFSSNYKDIRKYVWNNLTSLVDCKKVWTEVKLEQVMIILDKLTSTKEYDSNILKNQDILKLGVINKKISAKFGFFLNGISNKELSIANKMLEGSIFLNDVAENKRGFGLQQFIKNNAELNVIGGADIDRYMIRSFKGQIDKKDIPKEQSYINNNSVLVQNLVAHIENPTDHIKIICTIPQDMKCVIIDTINQITMNEDYPKEYIWILLNSNLINWYVYRFIYAKAIRTMHFDSPITSRIPIKKINSVIHHTFIQKADKMLELNKNLQETKQNFINELKLEKLTKKLQNFEELTFEEFVTEYTKLLKLKFADKLQERNFKQEWQAIFENDKTLASGYKIEIEQTDKEIDKMVYELYGLSDEEIEIVENQ